MNSTSPDTDPILLQLVHDLTDRTQAGKIKWDETDSADEYIFSAQSSSVLVSSKIDRDGDRVTNFTLVNSSGSEAASLRSSFSGSAEEGYAPLAINAELDNLFYAAKRNALDIDNTIKNIYDALQVDE